MTVAEDLDKRHPDVDLESGPVDERSPLLGAGPSSGAQPPETAPGYEEPGEDPPPEFQLYRPKHVITPSGDIYSHDHHLNKDGEALYQYLLSQAETPPSFLLRCRGTHLEEHVEQVASSEYVDGRYVSVSKAQTYTKVVTDFDFSIDIYEHLRQHPPVVWTVPDDEPTYRGRMRREVLTDTMGGVRRVSRKILKAGKAWSERRKAWGLPPWLGMTEQSEEARRSTPSDEIIPARSELTLRQWADRYCASNKCMKSFKFRKVVYGWNVEALRNAVRPTIERVYHVRSPTIGIEFITSSSEVDIRPSSLFSRALSKKWVVVILWITLVYPFIWLFRRCRGGRWEVAGAAFPIRSWKHCEDSIPEESAESYRQRTFKETTSDIKCPTCQKKKSEEADKRILAETPNGV
ncbi:hypothetical protein FRC11_002279, partial [Ceratobasidium sp. 423]